MFSMQGVGYLAAHLTGFVLLTAFPAPSSLAWRSLLGLGAVLPLGLAVALALARARRYRLVQSSLGEEEEEEDAMGVRRGGGASDEVSSPVRFWLAVRDKRRLLMKLIGTAGSWFLFDVTFYGNQLVSPRGCWLPTAEPLALLAAHPDTSTVTAVIPPSQFSLHSSHPRHCKMCPFALHASFVGFPLPGTFDAALPVARGAFGPFDRNPCHDIPYQSNAAR